tara:strand:+ start:352 stop:579 length:228 start_codon:yes stop_codon:yes gene_type:complete
MKIRITAKLDVKPPYVIKSLHFEGLRKIGLPVDFAKKYYEQGADEVMYKDISLQKCNNTTEKLKSPHLWEKINGI